jgi:tRNA A-37 threonylcarbamoyl transferase component Bud32
MTEDEGQVVGAYRILGQVGAGGMGTVWVAEHTMLGRRAALKLLHPEYSSRPEIVMRFFNEAKAAAAINDPGIVQIFDFGKHTDGRVYIVMELLEGEGLDRRLARLGALAVNDALRIVRQIASSLGAAHARGIIHRDLKPENLFLAYDPEVPGGERAKILDFGIAKLAKDQGSVKTNTSTLLGTPTFMSPEQCRGAGQLDQRSDVYSLGCVLFTLLTGGPPFVAEGPGDIIVMQMTVPAPLASSRSAGIPPAVDQLIARCLAKSPDDRFGSGAELAAAISGVLGGATGPQRPPTNTAQTQPIGRAVPAVTTLSQTAGSLVSAPPRRGRAVLAGAIGATVAIAIVVVFLATRDSAKQPPRDPVATQPPVMQPTGQPTTQPAPRPVTQPVAAAPDRGAETARQIAAAIQAFGGWAGAHASAGCPSLEDLGAAHDDAWGHPLVVTCTDQPAGQIIGIRSAGADGAPGTADDVASWQLDEVAALVRGAHWKPVTATAPVKPSSKPATRPTKPTKPTKPPVKPGTGTPGDTDGDGIPDSR